MKIDKTTPPLPATQIGELAPRPRQPGSATQHHQRRIDTVQNALQPAGARRIIQLLKKRLQPVWPGWPGQYGQLGTASGERLAIVCFAFNA